MSYTEQELLDEKEILEMTIRDMKNEIISMENDLQTVKQELKREINDD